MFDDVYLVERDACSCGTPMRMGWVEHEEKWMKQLLPESFLLQVSGESGEKRVESCSQQANHISTQE